MPPRGPPRDGSSSAGSTGSSTRTPSATCWAFDVELKEQLPEDGSADGFDNAGAAHHTSSFLMEKYLEAADKALNLAIANRPKPPPSIKKRL